MAKKSVSDYRKEYHVASLDEDSMDANPLKQFSHWFDEAARTGIGEPNAMVLSTSDRAGNISARVILLKGVERNGFVFYTSYDSRKGLQLSTNPKAALTFYWQPVERQVRVEGSVRKLPRKESMAYFNSRPADSRYSACISPQSCVIPDRAFLETMREGLILDLSGAPPPCPDNWGGYLLKPRMIEFWQGRPHRLHDRLRYRLKRDTWIMERLAP